jgi:NAD(P)-dependent dehydrogenase (short-subunit alcohol dehydrogenase family)
MKSTKVWFITGTSRGFGRERAIAALEWQPVSPAAQGARADA